MNFNEAMQMLGNKLQGKYGHLGFKYKKSDKTLTRHSKNFTYMIAFSSFGGNTKDSISILLKFFHAVINTVMARLVAAGHATICRIDDSPTIQRSNVSTPEIDSILKRGQFRQPGNLLCCQFSLQIGILHFKKSLADGSRMTNIHQ